MKKNTEIIIIDDVLPTNDPLIKVLGREGFKDIKLFSHSQEGIDYIFKYIENDFIVILDINFPGGEKNGEEVLAEIRKHNKLIPVIIWSAKDGTEYDFTSFINNHALYYVKQATSYKEILKRVNDAFHYLQLDIASAIERWLNEQEDKEQILSIDSDGNNYSARDLMKEIRMQSSEGRKIEKEIIELTIDLLFRERVKLDD